MKPNFMIARTVALALLCWMAPEGLKAETIAVRSGEHDGFTRIVLDLPSPRDWTLEQDRESARLVLKGTKARFDLRNAFRKIDTGRVRDLRVTEEANTLAIGLNCDCEIDAFRLGARMLVIDIKGGAADAPPPLRPRAAATNPASGDAQIKMANRMAIENAFPFDATPKSRRRPLGFGVLADKATNRGRNDPAKPSAKAATKIDTSIAARELDREKRISDSERRLAEQLSRAVSQGLVTPRAARLPKLEPQNPTEPESAPETGLQTVPETGVETPGLNLRAETSADRDFLEALDIMAVTKNGEACLSPDQLDISAWGGKESFSRAVGAYRATLMGEFDRPNTDTARKLARLYIHYGFGAEALLVLKASGIAGQDAALLQSMGEIMEYGNARSPLAFANQFDCDTPTVLWAILAHETIPSAVEINAEALLRTVSGLPPHLRNLLGPTVSDRLRLLQRDDLAGQVLRLVERGNQTPDARFEMAQAGQQLARGDVLSASDSLSNVVESNTELSPKALIQLIDSRLSANLPFDSATAELAGAYAQEYRKQSLGGDLKRVHILALSEAGAYDKAFAELALFAEVASPETTAKLRSFAMSALTEKSGDQPFLKHALGIEEQTISTLSAGSANAVARRLIALGFSARADRYLRSGADGAAGKERRLLRARAALSQMKPRRAEADLLGLSGAEVDSLRARARSMGGDHQTAQQLFATLEQNDRMIEEAWLAGDWNTLRSSGDALWIEVADMAEPTDVEPPVSDAEIGVLARNRALLTRSSAAREIIAGLLARYPLENALPSAE